MWMNENAGLLVLILGAALIALTIVVLCIVLSLRNCFTTQRLKFAGLYAMDVNTRQAYAALTVGNRSVSEIVIKEIGIKNGRVAFDLTPLYRTKHRMDGRARIVVEPRHSVDFTLSVQELSGVLVEGRKGGAKLRLYAVDLVGNLYQGRIRAVEKLLADSLAGKVPAPASPAPQPQPAPQPAPVRPAPLEEPAPAPVPIREFGKDTGARKLVVGPVAAPGEGDPERK